MLHAVLASTHNSYFKTNVKKIITWRGSQVSRRYRCVNSMTRDTKSSFVHIFSRKTIKHINCWSAHRLILINHVHDNWSIHNWQLRIFWLFGYLKKKKKKKMVQLFLSLIWESVFFMCEKSKLAHNEELDWHSTKKN